MQVTVQHHNETTFPETGACLVVPVYQDAFPVNSDLLIEADELAIQKLVDQDIIKGKAQECYYLPNAAGPYRAIIIAGLGKRDDIAPETLRRTAGKASDLFKTNRIDHVCFDITQHAELAPEAFLEGLVLAQYDFDVYKEQPKNTPAPVKVETFTVATGNDANCNALKEACDLAALVALGVNGARHLGNTPSNELTPAALAEFAEGIAEQSGCKCTILEEMQMASLGMNALLGVSQGSAQPPQLIILDYHHSDDAPTVAMVGKGITFDSGGISLKPGKAMHEMKFDMCGAAAVLCAMMSIVEIKPAVNVLCVVPAAENMPGPEAQRPGDIVTAYNGKTIEVHNTDAEGRLILADALAYTVKKYNPDTIVDLATLTGACVVALGHYAAGLFTTDDALAEALTKAGEISGDRVWRMPLWKDYEKLIEGTHADLCNIGPAGEAGSITAAAFLKAFVGDTPWAHLDIAGTAWGGKNISYLDANHATGFGVRLLIHWILSQAK